MVTPPSATAKTGLNVRAGPRTEFPIIAKLEQGISAPILGKSADAAWWEIAFPSTEDPGWVAAEFTTVRGETTDIAVIQVTAEPTRVTLASATAPADCLYQRGFSETISMGCE